VTGRHLVLLALVLWASGGPATAAPADDTDPVAQRAQRTAWLREVDRRVAAAQVRYDACQQSSTAGYQRTACLFNHAGVLAQLEREAFDRHVNEPGPARSLSHVRREAERAWTQYRDAQCRAVEISYPDGDAAGDGRLGCEVELTLLRLRDLSGPRD
jgi:uncharacterized protein YecT (DUF1311 family)